MASSSEMSDYGAQWVQPADWPCPHFRAARVCRPGTSTRARRRPRRTREVRQPMRKGFSTKKRVWVPCQLTVQRIFRAPRHSRVWSRGGGPL